MSASSSSPNRQNDLDDNNNNNDSHHDMRFGRFVIPSSHIFYRTRQSAAFVNLRPIVPGHVLVMPHRVVATLEELTHDEYIDLWMSVRVVQQVLKKHYSCYCHRTDDGDGSGGSGGGTTRHGTSELAFNVAVQDGRAAGQSVPHVHVHILPRKAGDYENMDDIYQELDDWAPRREDGWKAARRSDGSSATSIQVPKDEDRVDRTSDMMAEEASWYREIILSDTSKL